MVCYFEFFGGVDCTREGKVTGPGPVSHSSSNQDSNLGTFKGQISEFGLKF